MVVSDVFGNSGEFPLGIELIVHCHAEWGGQDDRYAIVGKVWTYFRVSKQEGECQGA